MDQYQHVLHAVTQLIYTTNNVSPLVHLTTTLILINARNVILFAQLVMVD